MKRAHRLNLFKLTASRTSTCDTDNALYRLNEKSLLCLNINLGCTVHCFVLFMNFKPSINFHLVLRYCDVHITTNAPPPNHLYPFQSIPISCCNTTNETPSPIIITLSFLGN